MPTSLTIAQFTDVHLGPIAGFTPRYWNAKRLSGYVNWHRKRRKAYSRDVLERLVADMHRQRPDHVVVTGDLANIGLPQEHIQGLAWLRTLGAPDAVSVIPGNHDIYGRLGRDHGVGRWQAYMTSCTAGAAWTGDTHGFPFVRVLGRVALIGVNSAITTPPLIAWGHVGEPQRERLGRLLDQLGRADLFRLVLIHHPPVPGQASRTRGLRDAAALEGVLERHGAELVIHGHNHLNSLIWRRSHTGPMPIVGAPSGSLNRAHKHEPLARYNLYRIGEPQDGRSWRIEMIGRGLAESGGAIIEIERRVLAMHEAGS